MLTDSALPTAPEATASGQQTPADQLVTQTTESTADDATGQPTEGEQKPAKTEAERELERLRKGIDRKTRQREEARAEAAAYKRELEQLRTTQSRATIEHASETDEPLTLSRAELDQMVNERAQKLAPTLKQQEAEIEHRRKVIDGLATELGQERFDALAEDLDEALGGLQRNGRMTPAAEAIFAADDPKAVITYLGNPDHADEAEAIGRMDPIRAAKAITRLETKLEQAKADAKPQRSKADPPVEPARGGGGALNDQPDPMNVKAWIAWANKQDRSY